MTTLNTSRTVGNFGMTLFSALLFLGLPAVMIVHSL